MNASLAFPTGLTVGVVRSLLQLLQPRVSWRLLLGGLAIGMAISAYAGMGLGYPKWAITAIMLATMLPVGIAKWRADRSVYGTTAMLISMLLIAQGVHTIEHIVQFVQYNVLWWTLRQSNGLLSPLNAEWVHFVWNWSVLLYVIVLVARGMRNPFAWLLLSISVFHTLEHTYMLVRYLSVLDGLGAAGVTTITAQGLPGFFGRDGWLARSPLTQGTIFCGLPGLTTATRLDVHFWWNVLETGALLLAAGAHMHLFFRRAEAPQALPATM